MHEVIARDIHHSDPLGGGTSALAVVADSLGFTEGPVVLDADHVLVTSMTRGLVYRLEPSSGRAEVLAEPGGGPNGLATTPDGRVLVLQSGGTIMPSRSEVTAPPSVQAIEADGSVQVLTTDVESPSDGVVGPDGRLWFTDPGEHDLEATTGRGTVRTLDLGTGAVEVVLQGLAFPNGLAFDAEGRLYVAETGPRTVRRFSTDGTADGWRVQLDTGRPDGIALDTDGSLWVTGSVGHDVSVFAADGTPARHLLLPAGHMVTSLCFAGQDLRTVVLTVPKGGRVLSLRVPTPGLSVPPQVNAS